MNIDINTKFIEILANLVLEQNKQLLQIIVEEKKIGYKKIMNYLPSQYEIKKQILQLSNDQSFFEKSNSISESSVSLSSSSDSEVE